MWEQRIAAAVAACDCHVASVGGPLPDARALRLALAGRRQGALALAAGEPVEWIGPRLARRLRRAARAWLRCNPGGQLDPAGELLLRAAQRPDVELGELVRAFAVDAKQRARRARAARAERLDAAHRRATRQREAILAAWPAWLQRDGDRLVLDRDNRFIQVRRLPSPDELASRELRCWLRAITALTWFAPASAVELTDPDGRYAYIPLDAGALDPGERTRGPWTSDQPRRQQARQRARQQRARKTRRRDG